MWELRTDLQGSKKGQVIQISGDSGRNQERLTGGGTTWPGPWRVGSIWTCRCTGKHREFSQAEGTWRGVEIRNNVRNQVLHWNARLRSFALGHGMKWSGYEGYRIRNKNLSHKAKIFSDFPFSSLLNHFSLNSEFFTGLMMGFLGYPQVRSKQVLHGCLTWRLWVSVTVQFNN